MNTTLIIFGILYGLYMFYTSRSAIKTLKNQELVIRWKLVLANSISVFSIVMVIYLTIGIFLKAKGFI